MTKSNNVRERHQVYWPSLAWVLAKPTRLLAFGFGVGLLRPGSGTWGSVLALLLWWPMVLWIPDPWLGALVLLSVVLGVWICGRAADELAVPDHVGIVWDEIAALWLLLWVLPNNLWAALLGFLLFRVFDIGKPAPIAWLDRRLKGGFGVMLDDLVAALYAGVLVFGAYFLLQSVWPGVMR